MDNNHLFQYITSGQLMKFYKSKEWKALRVEALERDNYECQMCKENGKYHKAECVHHIKEVKPYPHLAMTLSNLKSLCNPCHNKVHDRIGIHLQEQGKKFVNEERW
ncbi:HNH endonuclease [Cytobacillus firmus]|uniref:Putative HNH nuclease YajD n=1 Tax=Cytobacillus firmus DS1 TaxID=1307436 RepID=W7L195_CYTFI|nr:HNH endonuclease [Cytobacillus firmus]EWG08892.1 Gp54 protein [Cytobacillus firmus DS1]